MVIISGIAAAQDPVCLGETFPDFTLMSHEGDSVSLSEFEGSNILLIFPRGRFRDGWCRACHYQYAELAELQDMADIEEKYNLKVLFVLPYSLDVVKEWITVFPSQMELIEQFKNPSEERRSNPRIMRFAEEMQRAMPKSFIFSEEDPAPLPFPVLADEDHKLSSQLELFTTYWDQFYFEQNEPTIFILDGDGKVKFKYKSQVTLDRPSAEYLLEYVDEVMN